ncbi:hypothetical protein ACLB2K_034941 [Fragaria x ananassa]
MVSVQYLCPNEYVFPTALSSCSDSGRVEEGKQYHGYVLKAGLQCHQYVKNELVQMYSSCSGMEGAMRVLNAVLGDCMAWNSATYVTVFGLCAQLKDLRLGMQVHSGMLKANMKCNVFLSSAIVDMHWKCGKVCNAVKIFDGLQTRNIFSWTAVMAAYFQNGYFEEALVWCQKWNLKKFVQMNILFLSCLTHSCTELCETWSHGDLLHARVRKSGFKYHVVVGNALINMYSKCGNIQAANALNLCWVIAILPNSHQELSFYPFFPKPFPEL